MRSKPISVSRAWLCGAVLLLVQTSLSVGLQAAATVVIGWSEVGLHEMDGSDVSVYALMPPYNTIHAQVISGGKLVLSTNGLQVTYEAVADAAGSINTSSKGKGNFYQYAQALYGTPLAADQGLAGFGMPGAANRPQLMTFDPTNKVFTAVGIPLTPYDDKGAKNSFPMMRVVARDGTGKELAHTDIVVPVSDEMDCRACHASGAQTAARPPTGWTWDCDPTRDYKLNILRYHDDYRAGSSEYTNVLSQVGYNPAGLLPTVLHDGKPVLCIRCHASDALSGSGATGMRPLTRLIHTKHAKVLDPQLGSTLDDVNNNGACFRCHAGNEASYVRGVHHNTVNPDGTRTMQCQSCHGSLSTLGDRTRQGWLDEPNCQSCHTGNATSNRGQIRYTSVFETPGKVRQSVDQSFGTQTNTPATGLSLFRSSTGHGGLYCEACHGSTHVELASSQSNDNVQSQQLQGHPGTMIDCAPCHATTSNPYYGGPHGMHDVGQVWVSEHGDAARSTGQSWCANCHAADLRGTVLALMPTDRTLNVVGSLPLWRGFEVGCYACHESDSGPNQPAKVSNLSTNTTANRPLAMVLHATDTDGDPLTLRVITQPVHGSVAISNNVATYFPASNFVGSDTFTFSAWDGWTESNLGNAQVTVAAGDCTLTAGATAPTAALPGSSVPFRGSGSVSQCVSPLTYDWDFGDGSPHAPGANLCHTYTASGDYAWTLTVTAGGIQQTVHGIVTISPTLGSPLPLTITRSDAGLVVSWPVDRIPAVLESASALSQPMVWQLVLDQPVPVPSGLSLEVNITSDQQLFRLRRVP